MTCPYFFDPLNRHEIECRDGKHFERWGEVWTVKKCPKQK